MEQELIAGLMARGASYPVAVGLVANMKAESALNPSVNEAAPVVAGSRGGYGLNQWTGPRRRQYEAFAADRGADPADVNTQLDFTMWEMQNTERGAWNALQGVTDPTQAAKIVSERYLRPGIPHLDRRMGYAAELAGQPFTGSAGNYLSQPQQQPQQNALTLADYGYKANLLDPSMFMNSNALRSA